MAKTPKSTKTPKKKARRKPKPSWTEPAAPPAPQATKIKRLEPDTPLLQPMDDRIIICLDDPLATSEGGIVIVASAQEQSQFGAVVAVGPGRPWLEYVVPPRPTASDPLAMTGPPLSATQMLQPRYPMTVKVGDRVLVAKYGGQEVALGGETYTILREADVIATCR